jgi:hypothetical protein
MWTRNRWRAGLLWLSKGTASSFRYLVLTPPGLLHFLSIVGMSNIVVLALLPVIDPRWGAALGISVSTTAVVALALLFVFTPIIMAPLLPLVVWEDKGVREAIDKLEQELNGPTEASGSIDPNNPDIDLRPGIDRGYGQRHPGFNYVRAVFWSWDSTAPVFKQYLGSPGGVAFTVAMMLLFTLLSYFFRFPELAFGWRSCLLTALWSTLIFAGGLFFVLWPLLTIVLLPAMYKWNPDVRAQIDEHKAKNEHV